MLTRRNLLKSSAAALPVLAMHGRKAWSEAHIPLGLQLYTLRQQAQQDLPGTLKQVRAIGYTEIELYGDSYTYPAKQLQQILYGAGLRAPSGHFGFDTMPDKIEYAKQLELDWVVCPSIPKSMWSLDGFRAAAKQFNDFGKRALDLGMRFAFHNHAYEFADYGGGKTGYDILVDETDPSLVFFELDCYWAAQAGHDPLQLLNKMGRRIRMLHLKDRKAGFPPSTDMGRSSAHFAPVGEGTIQWKPILDSAKSLRIEHYFVEQDDTYGHPIQSIRSSYSYLRTLIS